MWFCFLVVLLSYSWFGRQVWVFNYFFLTSWNFMASPRLHHFSIACSSFNDCFLLYLEPQCFQFLSFWTLWWRSIRAAFNAAYLVIVVKIFILYATCITWWISFGLSYRSLIIDFSSIYLMPLDSLFRHFGGSSVFGGSLYVFILSF